MKLHARRNKLLLIGCLLLINALALLPLLGSGFIADDILNSQIRGHMIQTNRSLWGVTSFYAMHWLKDEGRLFPLGFFAYSVFYVLGNVLLYKLFVLGVILSSIAAFFAFIRRVTGSELIPVIAVLLLPLMFQFRASWDPILAFCAQYPLIALLLFCSLNLFLRALDEGNRRSVWLAALLFLCSGLIFEVTYPMFLVFGCIAYLRLKSVKEAARAAWPFLAVTVSLAVTSLILRSQATALSNTYRMNFDLIRLIKTYCVQLLGAVPFSYFLFDPHAVFAIRLSAYPRTLVYVLPLVVLLAGFTVLVLRRRLSREEAGRVTADRTGIVVLAVLLLAIPPSLISLSPKFQAQIWGDAYLPVYLTCFGLCMLLAVGLEKLYREVALLRMVARFVVPTAVCCWLLLLGFNFRSNWFVMQANNEAVWSPRVLVEEALEKGLLARLSPKAVLLVSGTDPWDNADEYSRQTGVGFSVYRLKEVRDLTPIFQGRGATCAPAADQQICDFAADAEVYTVQIRHLTDGTGAVLLARVQRSYQSNGSIRGLLSKEVVAYFRLPASAQPLAVALSGRDTQQRTGSGAFRASERNLDVVREGRGWKLVFLQRRTPFDALSLRGEITAERAESAILAVKSREAFELHASGPELLHVGFQSGNLGNGVEYPAIEFSNDMSIEVLVVPGDAQGRYADILSNHWVDSRGFTMETVDSRRGLYATAFGTGRRWMEVGTFSLNPGRRNYVALQVKDRIAQLYVNGNAAASTVLPEPIAASPHPFRVGNWKGGDRPYDGWIEEVLIARGAKSTETVLADARRLETAKAGNLPKRPLFLVRDEAALLHKGFDAEGPPDYVLPNTVPLPDSFTVELLVRPASVQSAYATILSNHPGKKGFQGFSIEQVLGTTNRYALGFGNGKAWMPVADFFLSPTELHYLAVTKEKRQVNVYLDGRRISERRLGADLAASEFPLRVGNWVNKDRPFNGAIPEVRIALTEASAGTIAARAEALRRVSPR